MDKAPKEKTGETGEGKKLLIRDLIIKEGKVNLATSLPIGKNISAALPDIHLKNIGGEKEGASSAKVVKEILTALYSKITSPDVTKVLNEELKAVSKMHKNHWKGLPRVQPRVPARNWRELQAKQQKDCLANNMTGEIY